MEIDHYAGAEIPFVVKDEWEVGQSKPSPLQVYTIIPHFPILNMLTIYTIIFKHWIIESQYICTDTDCVFL